MRARSWIASAVVAALAGGAWWWAAHAPRPPGASTAARPPTVATAAASPARVGAGPLLPLAPPRASDDGEAFGEATEDAVAIAPDVVLARVNGVELRLAELTTVEPGARGPLRLPAAELRYLLDRAIDRELVGQAARAAGVALDEQQARQLAAVRDQLAARADAGDRELTRTPAYVAFDVRDTEGLMLQANLTTRAGVPSEHVTPADVDAHYRAHQADFAPLPSDPAARAEAWAAIEGAIRDQLAPARAVRHREAVAAFLRDLRARAAVDEAEQVAARR